MDNKAGDTSAPYPGGVTAVAGHNLCGSLTPPVQIRQSSLDARGIETHEIVTQKDL